MTAQKQVCVSLRDVIEISAEQLKNGFAAVNK